MSAGAGAWLDGRGSDLRVEQAGKDHLAKALGRAIPPSMASGPMRWSSKRLLRPEEPVAEITEPG
jgi:hypothetical protein